MGGILIPISGPPGLQIGPKYATSSAASVTYGRERSRSADEGGAILITILPLASASRIEGLPS